MKALWEIIFFSQLSMSFTWNIRNERGCVQYDENTRSTNSQLEKRIQRLRGCDDRFLSEFYCLSKNISFLGLTTKKRRLGLLHKPMQKISTHVNYCKNVVSGSFVNSNIMILAPYSSAFNCKLSSLYLTSYLLTT